MIASPKDAILQRQEGNPGMGDVLTGSITVQLHATAAGSLVNQGIGPIGLTSSETILEMRSLLNKLL